MVPKNDDENFHYSFATKFCKYVSNAFTSDIEAKKIFKFDKKKYTNEKEIIEQYRKFYNCLEDIRNNTTEKITRNEMDHIIWYSNK